MTQVTTKFREHSEAGQIGAIKAYNSNLRQLVIPEREYSIKGKRDSGPGGQNRNKVSSAAELRFRIEDSSVLSNEEKARLRRHFLNTKRFNNTTGEVVISAAEHRDFQMNRTAAVQRLTALVRKALVLEIPRQKRKKGRSTKAREKKSNVIERQRKARRREGRRFFGDD